MQKIQVSRSKNCIHKLLKKKILLAMLTLDMSKYGVITLISLAIFINPSENGPTWPRFYNGTVFSPATPTQRSLSVDNTSESDVRSIPDESEVRSGALVEAPQSLEHETSTTSPASRASINEELENYCKNNELTSRNTHAHPHLCTKYIECGPSGTMFVKTCGPGTVFNPQLSVCDWPSNVEGCDGDDDDNRDVHNTIRKRSILPHKLEKRGIAPDPSHCNKYRLLSSVGGHYSTHKCGEGTLFNPLSSVCDFADNVDCSSRIVDFGRYACSTEDRYKAPHPDHCDKFVECDRGTLAVKNCPPGTLYGREDEKCEHAVRVQCRKKISLVHDIDKREANRLNLACDFNYIAPHPHNCHQFVECEQGRLFIKNCGPGTAFNPYLAQCDWPHKVRQHDSNDCTRYRQCVRTQYETRSCVKGQIFDERSRICRPPRDYREQECSQRGGYPTPATTTTRRTTTTAYTTEPPFITPKPS